MEQDEHITQGNYSLPIEGEGRGEGLWTVSEVYGPAHTMAQMASDDQPRERLLQYGAEHLSTAELIAILLRSGNTEETVLDLARRLLHDCGGSLRTLGQMSVEEMCEYKGIGEAKAITVLAACELGRRRQKEEARERLDVSSSRSIFELMQPIMQDLTTEEAYILLLNTKLQLLNDPIRISHGGLQETAVDIRVVGKHALLSNATALILCHNHPSGSLRPSRNDDMITKQVKEGLRTLNIRLMDHLIITATDYYSYNDNGKI